MNYQKKTVRDIDVKGKKVLLRCDFNVPQDKKTGAITSTLSPSWVIVPLPTTTPVVRQSSPATSSELPQAARLRQSAMASTGIKICFHRFFMVLLPFHHSIM